MKRMIAIAGMVALIATGFVACKKSGDGGTTPKGPALTAVWGSNTVKKPAAKSLAKSNGPNQVTLYVYSFPTKDTYPDADSYKADDWFVEATIKVPEGRAIEAGTFTAENLSGLTIHTKEMNVIIGKAKSSIVISSVGGGKIKGELKLDDGSAKVTGPFEMDMQ